MPAAPSTTIGQMQYRVRLQTLVETVDQYGQPVQDWSEGIRVWARVRPPTGREMVNADQLKVEMSHVVTMRYRAGVDDTQQLLWGDKVLRITDVRPDESKVLMDVYCVARSGESEADV